VRGEGGSREGWRCAPCYMGGRGKGGKGGGEGTEKETEMDTETEGSGKEGTASDAVQDH